jgi:hypothetical protein
LTVLDGTVSFFEEVVIDDKGAARYPEQAGDSTAWPETGDVSKTRRYFNISREIFYQSRRSFQRHIKEDLVNSKPCPENPRLRIAPEIDERIISLGKDYDLAHLWISRILECYHPIKVSAGGLRGPQAEWAEPSAQKRRETGSISSPYSKSVRIRPDRFQATTFRSM